MEVSNLQGFKNVSNFAKLGLGYKSPQKINRLKESGNKPSIDIIEDIVNKYNINSDWLIFGKGEMLNQPAKTGTPQKATETPQISNKPTREGNYIRDRISEYKTELQEEQVSYLRSELAQAYIQIGKLSAENEALKNAENATNAHAKKGTA